MIFRSRIIPFLFVIFLTGLNYYLLGFYIKGDQTYYRLLYSTFSETNYRDIFFVAIPIIGSSEPFTLTILWLGTQLGIEKDLYISLYNFLLLIGLWLFCRQNKSGVLILFLIFTNYYIVVLMTSAERLKFAFILITYAFVFFDKKWIRSIFLISSILAHFQSALFLLGLGAYRALANKVIISSRISISGLFIKLISILFVCIISYYFYDNISHKLIVYIGNGDIYSLIKPLILFIVSLLSLKSYWSAIKIFIVMSPLFYIFGDNRMTMVYFLVLFYFLGIEGRLKRPAFLVLMAYFSVKSIGYVTNIFSFGTGFV